ncbi:MAG: C40 family peptidase [Oscillospiraceae bacterium]|nr:C40 family peptidase [Oscillospiraceae bacterium]
MPRFCQGLRTLVISAALFTLCAVSASATDLGVGTVTGDGLRLRSEASTGSAILTTANTGDLAIVLEDVGDGWYKVDYHSTEGYMSAQYIDLSTTIETDLGYGLVQTEGSTLNLRSGPGTDYDRVAILSDNTVVTLLGMDNGWFKLRHNDTVGYASSDYIVTCLNAAGDRGDTVLPAANASLAQQIIAYAKQSLGKPYVWGGNGPNSFDCSGFTKYVYAHFGYNLNRTASAQLNNGVAVTRDQLQPGDLIFFYNGKVSTPVSHVGIYIGNGDFIHASSNSYTVEIDTLYAAHNSQKYVYARRII